VNSNKDERSFIRLKNHFRKNIFEHKEFDKFLNSQFGRKYYMNVNKMMEYEDLTRTVIE